MRAYNKNKVASSKMCRHECCCNEGDEELQRFAIQQYAPVVMIRSPPRLFMSSTAAALNPGSEALAPRSNIRRNVIPKNLERFTEGPLPKQPDVERLSSRVICILGQNPSGFTLNGTNIYLIGTGKRRVLLDAGEGSPKAELVLALLTKVFKAEGVEGLDEIIITHLHHDHVGAALEISKRFGPCRISKYPTPQTEVDRRKEVIRIEQEKAGIVPESGIIPKAATITWIGLDFELNSNYHRLFDGELVSTEGASLRILWTPGHASDHIVVLLEEEHSLFSGDLILGYGTSWVDDLASYMASLRKLEALAPVRLYP
jgi:glyoxylase-like metal-dependent hydrolase (beta-lactamase superfamily II)